MLVGFLEFGSSSYADRNGKCNARKMGKVFKDLRFVFLLLLVGGEESKGGDNYIHIDDDGIGCFMLYASLPIFYFSGFRSIWFNPRADNRRSRDKRRSSNKVQTFT